MSWTKRLTHPNELVNLGDEIEVVVLSVDRDKQEISLGLKQTQTNPWAIASQKYPPGAIVTATVRSLTNFGAFVEIEPGVDGMIHISDLSWTRKHSHPGEALQKNMEIKCIVLEVNEEKRRISLGIKQMTEDPWIRAIPEKYIPGHIIKGKVAKLTNFGAFVELEPELEGLLHISELADHKVDKPQDVVKVGNEVEVKILKVDTDARKIGLSLRRVQWAAEEQAAEPAAEQKTPTGPEKVLSDADVEQITKSRQKSNGEVDKSNQPQNQEERTEIESTSEKKEQEESTSQQEANETTDSEPSEQDQTKKTQENAEIENIAGEEDTQQKTEMV
jgi:small subunit ribosomal protein S1